MIGEYLLGFGVVGEEGRGGLNDNEKKRGENREVTAI